MLTLNCIVIKVVYHQNEMRATTLLVKLLAKITYFYHGVIAGLHVYAIRIKLKQCLVLRN